MSRVKWFRWSAIALFWLILTVVLLELGLRAFASSLPPDLQALANLAAHGTPFAEPWEHAWIRNPDHYFILKPGLVDALQFGSPQVRFHVNTIELWEGGGVGFRTRPVDYFVDAVVVGDSFAFCFTERADCWVWQLEAASGMGIVNLGLPGTGSRSHQLVLRDFGRPLRPPLVIWQFFGNDFNDDYGLAAARAEIEPVAESADAADDSAAAEPVAAWLRTHSALFAVVEKLVTGERQDLDAAARQFEERYEARTASGEILRFGQPYEPVALDMSRSQNQAGYELSRAAFAAARDLVRSWGGDMVVVLTPTREEVYAPLTASALGADLDAIRSARLAMLALCSELNCCAVTMHAGGSSGRCCRKSLALLPGRHAFESAREIASLPSFVLDWLERLRTRCRIKVSRAHHATDGRLPSQRLMRREQRVQAEPARAVGTPRRAAISYRHSS